MNQKQLSIGEKGLNSQINFQLIYFNSPESTDTKGFLKSLLLSRNKMKVVEKLIPVVYAAVKLLLRF